MREKLGRSIDHLGFLRRTLGELTGYSALAFELIQNADDTQRATTLRFDVRDEALWVEDDGGFTDCGDQEVHPDYCPLLKSQGHRCDFHSFRLVSGADKRLRENTTGAFGIGFTAVYQVTDLPEIVSGSRHWRVDETASEAERIDQERIDPPHEGTRIILPWARDPRSEFRRRANVAVVSENAREELLAALEEAVAPAMLFLRNLGRIEIARNGAVVSTVTCEANGQELLIDDRGSLQRWHILRGTFDEVAADLRQKHGQRIEGVRKPAVAVAIPVGFDVDGRLCATLPTARGTGLPVHVSAEFYLTSDRRQLAMGAPHYNDWNAAAIDCAAGLLAEALGNLPELLGPHRMWGALEGARNLARERPNDAVDAALAAFWGHLEPEVSRHPLVWTSSGRWVTTGEARLIEHDDAEALPTLERLGASIAHPDLRARRNILRAAGVRLLGIADVAARLPKAGPAGSVKMSGLPSPLDDDAVLRRLWSQIGRMIGRTRGDEKRTARTALGAALIVPSTNGRLCTVEELWRADASSIALLSGVAPGFPFLDSRRMPEEAAPLAELCVPLGAPNAIRRLASEDLRLDLGRAHRLIGWLASREDELGTEDRAALAALPIFPSAGDLHTLDEIALPGNFDDPLELALLVDRDTGREYGTFLERLGVERLSFDVYAMGHIPRAFEEMDLSTGQRRRVVQLLARHHGELRDSAGARAALATVPLVECTDGAWHVAGEVYFDGQSVRQVLGSGPPRALMPTEHASSVRELLAWLGVAHEPRAVDVVARVRGLVRQEADPPRRRAVEQVVAWLGGRWKALEPREQKAFAPLRELGWLPLRGGEGWHAPSTLDLAFREYLYASQGRFLDVGYRVQGEAVELLRWLQLKDAPRVDQVVAHLRHCASTDTQPNSEIYTFLSDNTQNPAVLRLREVPCLRIEGRWYRPDQVYWSGSPFGEWRLRLGPDFARHRKLWDALGVKDAPDHTDAIKVISEISEKYVTYHQRLPESDLRVLINCWELCEAALRRGEVTARTLANLGKQKVIADRRNVLAGAEFLFFEDVPNLAQRFPDLRDVIINRPIDAWRAMQAAGVRDLGKVAEAQVLDAGDSLDDTLHPRLIERAEVLARAIGTALAEEPWRDVALRMEALRIKCVTAMKVRWQLRAFKNVYKSDPDAAYALWHPQQQVLYVTVRQDGPVWEAFARELVRALLPEVEPSVLALGVATALRAGDREAAERALDDAGYPPLAPEIRAEISTITATGLDAGIGTLPGPHPEETGWAGGHVWPDEVDEDGGAEETGSRDGEGGRPGTEGRQENGAGGSDRRGDTGTREGSTAAGQAGGTGVSDRQDRPPGGEADSGGDGLTGNGNADAGDATSTRPRGRLRSYVENNDSPDGESATGDNELPSAVDEAGVEAVVRFEEDAGRVPKVEPHNNPGYDVLSTLEDGDVARYIEIKSTAGPWEEMGVALSRKQFRDAWRKKEQYWLYVVEHALDDERRRIWRVPNPAGHVTHFMFDDGWKDTAEDAPKEVAEL